MFLDESVDFVFVDLFYNFQFGGDLYCLDNFKVDVVDNDWDQIGGFDEYDLFIWQWLEQVCCVFKFNGGFWVIGSYYNIYCVGFILQDVGFWVFNDIIWCKFNLMLNFKGIWFINVYEILLWVVKIKDVCLIFNYVVMKVFNDGVQMCFDWMLLICFGGECLKDVDGKKVYLMQKLEVLLYCVLLLMINLGDVVFDLFFGIGMIGVAVKCLGCYFIGVECDEIYIVVVCECLLVIEFVVCEVLDVM